MTETKRAHLNAMARLRIKNTSEDLSESILQGSALARRTTMMKMERETLWKTTAIVMRQVQRPRNLPNIFYHPS